VEEVADTLRALETDARALQAQVEAEKAAPTRLRSPKKPFRAGGVSYVDCIEHSAFCFWKRVRAGCKPRRHGIPTQPHCSGAGGRLVIEG